MPSQSILSSLDLVIGVIYRRVSSRKQQKQGMSLEDQIEICQRYAVAHDMVLGQVYTDVMTGRRDDRPAYHQMLTDLRELVAQGTRVALVVAAGDRFGRNGEERIGRRKALLKLGVAIHQIREGGVLEPFMADMYAIVAEEEVRRMGARIRESRHRTRSLGWYTPGRAGWGYRLRARTVEEQAQGATQQVLDADPVAAPAVAEAFLRVAGGESARQVHRWIHGLPAEARQGKVLNLTGFLAMLRNPMYAGRAAHLPAGVVPRWPALIEPAIFDAVQACLDGHQRMAHQGTARYLLTGLLRCPRCDGRLHGQPPHQRLGVHYRCDPQQAGGKRGCGWRGSAARIDAAVLAEVQPLMLQTRNLDDLLRAWDRVMESAATIRDHRLARQRELRRTVEATREELRRLSRLRGQGKMKQAYYELAVEAAEEERAAAQRELDALGLPAMPKGSGRDRRAVQAALDTWPLDLAASEVRVAREVLAQLVARVVPRRVGYRAYVVEIEWTPLGTWMRGPEAWAAGRDGGDDDDPGGAGVSWTEHPDDRYKLPPQLTALHAAAVGPLA